MRTCASLVMVLGTMAACSSTDSAASSGRRTGSADRSREPVGEVMPHQECVGTGGDVISMDVNRDGQPDIRTVMEGGRPRCREVDANFDGRVDIYRWFDPANGQTTRVEDDYDFDGRIDVVATYENGVIVRDILDTNFDGRTDTWRDYRAGQLFELRRDANGDGRVDTWERYDTEGRITYSARDNDHDGEPDREPDRGPAAEDAGARAVDATSVPSAAPATNAEPANPTSPASASKPMEFR